MYIGFTAWTNLKSRFQQHLPSTTEAATSKTSSTKEMSPDLIISSWNLSELQLPSTVQRSGVEWSKVHQRRSAIDGPSERGAEGRVRTANRSAAHRQKSNEKRAGGRFNAPVHFSAIWLKNCKSRPASAPPPAARE